MGMRSSGGGEIVEVQGGHILRSTGRKDRHSKVYTAKGPRDRRVRLSAHTAIQFYDVQDRLGYDRPSKAVDWLIKKAKSAIDKLAESQPFEPDRGFSSEMVVNNHEQEPKSPEYDFQINRQIGGVDDDENNTNHQKDFSSSSFVSPLTNLDADTMKSFFPTSSSNSNINFQSYPHDIISRTTNPNQDLGLSLHPFQGNTNPSCSADHTLFVGSANPVSFDASFQRLSGWNGLELAAEHRGFMVNSQPPVALLNQQAMILCQGPPQPALLQSHHQRGALMSSFGQSFRACDGDQISTVDHQEDKTHSIPSSILGSRFGPHGIMPGFGVDRPSSSSSSPHHSNH